ncbi:DnaJ domain-containing protein [Thiocapsa sp. UBA6158]|jgi:ketosteroid isomerase-like protein|uniref:DnaJ domain-containing protein n=1 Tax=Thiocapsa sp. UBA6158 TaxID=1947692 RepID=UPI0025F9F39F|nr:DnaJ domain-containing protein [Thiocapsa sp. UBA6158]
MPLNEDAARAVAACLCEHLCAAPVMAHLDAVLAWLIQPERPSSRTLDDAILKVGLTREQAVERAYGLLDELLLAVPAEAPDETLGLKGETDPAVIKQRYRRLIAIYHPDRHPARSADLNRRTERINRAYRLLMQRHAGGDADWTGGGARARSFRPSVRVSPVAPAWRARAEDPGRRPSPALHARPYPSAPARRDAWLIQRRLIQAMVLCCAALVAILLLGEDPLEEPHGAPSAVPTIAKAAPAPKTLQAPGSVGTDACAGASEALERFRQAYQTGSADGLANLFTLDARERESVGRASIRRLYADWFSSTSGRSISFAGVSTQSAGMDLCRLRVRFDVGYQDANGRARSQTGQISALLKRDGGRTLIQELSH